MLHQDQIHEKSRRPPVPVHERVDVDELVVRECGEADGVEVEVLGGVEPEDESLHEDVYVGGVWWDVVADVDLEAEFAHV